MLRIKCLRAALCAVLVSAAITASGCAGPPPRDALVTFSRAVQTKDWNTAWGLLSSRERKNFEEKMFAPFKEQFAKLSPEAQKEAAAKIGSTVQDIQKMAAKDFFSVVMEKSDESRKIPHKIDPDRIVVEQESIKGNTARIRLKGQAGEFNFVKEAGAWKIELGP
ncbi:MAG: hypothetical protein RDV48_22145 [Candidatus Eremiobacteraeota bacterium]|nr:hypothetical protein [Candidatus Eremiobacteraeota bacterium]